MPPSTHAATTRFTKRSCYRRQRQTGPALRGLFGLGLSFAERAASLQLLVTSEQGQRRFSR